MESKTRRIEASKLVNFATEQLNPQDIYDDIGFTPTWSDLAHEIKNSVVLQVLKRRLNISTDPEVTAIIEAGVRDTSTLLRTDIKALQKAGRPIEEAEAFMAHPETVRTIARIGMHPELWGEHITAYVATRENVDLPQDFLPSPDTKTDHSKQIGCPYAARAEVDPATSKYGRLVRWSGAYAVYRAYDTTPGLLYGEYIDLQKARKAVLESYITASGDQKSSAITN